MLMRYVISITFLVCTHKLLFIYLGYRNSLVGYVGAWACFPQVLSTSFHLGDSLVGYAGAWARFPRVLPAVFTSEMALWAMWVYGPAFRGSSPQSSHRRWPCGPRERMVPLSAGPPHSLQIEDGLVGHVGVWARFPRVLPTVSTSEMALWALWVYGPAFRRSSPQSPHRRWLCGPCGCMGLLSAGPPHNLQMHIFASETGHVGPGLGMSCTAGHSPPTSLNTKVSCRGDHVGHWRLDGRIGRASSLHPFCLGFI